MSFLEYYDYPSDLQILPIYDTKYKGDINIIDTLKTQPSLCNVFDSYYDQYIQTLEYLNLHWSELVQKDVIEIIIMGKFLASVKIRCPKFFMYGSSTVKYRQLVLYILKYNNVQSNIPSSDTTSLVVSNQSTSLALVKSSTQLYFLPNSYLSYLWSISSYVGKKLTSIYSYLPFFNHT